MSLTLTLLSLTFIASFVVLLVSVLNAPEGHEDEHGFHLSSAGKQKTGAVIRVKVSTQPFVA
ncbi:MAG: hypothetical protein ABI273_03675 [Lacunisphaera sp.]